MAEIPTYIYIGDGQCNGSGAQPGLDGLFWTFTARDPVLIKNVPESGSAYAPWWDGVSGTQYAATGATSSTITVASATWTTDEFAGKTVYIDAGTGAGQTAVVASNTGTVITITGTFATTPTGAAFHVATGKWVRYRHIRGAVDILPSEGTNGDNWYASSSGGFGPTTMLMQLLPQMHPSSPYFRVFKYAQLTGFAGLNGGAPWTAFLAEWNKATASTMFGAGDTPDLRGVIVDSSYTDIANLNTNYLADIAGVYALIVANIGDVPIFVVNHSGALLDVSAVYSGSAYAAAIRTANKLVASFSDKLRLVDMNDAVLNADSDATGYSTQAYLDLGRKLFNAIDAYYTDAPTVAPGTGIPTFIMLGDSQAVGTIDYSYLLYGKQESLLGEFPGSVRAGHYVYVEGSNQVQLYDVTANENANGASGSSTFGPSASFLRRMAEYYPDGVLLLKVAQGGATMTLESQASIGYGTFDPGSTGDLWTDTETWFSEMANVLWRDLQRVMDVRGVVSILGDNETNTDETAEAFATKLPVFVDTLRETFQTRTDGTLKVVWHNPPLHTGNGGQSVKGTASANAAVRDALAAQALTDSSFRVISDTDLELQWDNIHYGGEATLTLGDRAAELLLTMLSDEGEATATATSTVSVTAAFTVEDGSGLASANAYCSVAFADTYHEQFGNPVGWTGLSTAQKQDAIRTATRAADDRYGSRWNGVRAVPDTQSLDWPRSYVIDRDGNDVASTSIPASLARWTARAAMLHAQGFDLLPVTQDSATVTSESVSSASGASESRTYKGGLEPSTQFPALDRMLSNAGLIESGGGWSGAIA